VRFTGHSREEIYDWVGKTLRKHDYAGQGREAKGVLRSYVAKMTGQSRAQITRLFVITGRATVEIQNHPPPCRRWVKWRLKVAGRAEVGERLCLTARSVYSFCLEGLRLPRQNNCAIERSVG